MEVFIREARNWEAVTDKFLVYQSRRIVTPTIQNGANDVSNSVSQ